MVSVLSLDLLAYTEIFLQMFAFVGYMQSIIVAESITYMMTVKCITEIAISKWRKKLTVAAAWTMTTREHLRSAHL